MPVRTSASRPEPPPADLLAQQVHVRKRQQPDQRRAQLQAEEREPGAEDPRHQQRPVHLQRLAARVAREEDVRLSPADVIHVQQLLGMVAEWFGRRLLQVVQPEEQHQARLRPDTSSVQRSIRISHCRVAPARSQTARQNEGLLRLRQPKGRDDQPQARQPQSQVEASEEIVREGQEGDQRERDRDEKRRSAIDKGIRPCRRRLLLGQPPLAASDADHTNRPTASAYTSPRPVRMEEPGGSRMLWARNPSTSASSDRQGNAASQSGSRSSSPGGFTSTAVDCSMTCSNPGPSFIQRWQLDAAGAAQTRASTSGSQARSVPRSAAVEASRESSLILPAAAMAWPCPRPDA